MIVTEYFKTRNDGIVLNRTYSDRGMVIERDGIRYSEAVDPAELNRQYTETDDRIISDESAQSELEQKAKAYDIITGVSE